MMALRFGLGNQLMSEPHVRGTQVLEQPPSTSNTGASSTLIWGQASVADGKAPRLVPTTRCLSQPAPPALKCFWGHKVRTQSILCVCSGWCFAGDPSSVQHQQTQPASCSAYFGHVEGFCISK